MEGNSEWQRAASPPSAMTESQKTDKYFSFFSLPEHNPSQSDGPFPVFQGSFPCQVYKLLGTDKLVVEL